MSKTLGAACLDFQKAYEELNKQEEKSESYKLIVHPSVVSYDYRIAWTWEEMEKRNERNNDVDQLRLMFGMPARPYGKPLYSERTTHRGKKERPLKFNEWW